MILAISAVAAVFIYHLAPWWLPIWFAVSIAGTLICWIVTN